MLYFFGNFVLKIFADLKKKCLVELLLHSKTASYVNDICNIYCVDI